MKTNTWRPSLLALLISAGLVACADRADDAGTETGQVSTPATEATTATDQAATSDPYATTPMESTDPMAPTSDISGTAGTAGMTQPTDTMGTTGDMTSGDMTGTTGDAADRCAGLAGQALTECLAVEATREQPMDNPSETNPTDLPDR